jgi:hypothetical protein
MAESSKVLHTTATPVEQAETKAAHAAMLRYMQVLHEELGKLGATTVVEALGRTAHIHHIAVTGSQPGLIELSVRFDGSAEAAATARRLEALDAARRPA